MEAVFLVSGCYSAFNVSLDERSQRIGRVVVDGWGDKLSCPS